MKKLNKLQVIIICIFALLQIVTAQTPQAFKYQVVARDNAGLILANQNISFRMSIIQGALPGMVVYSEIHLVTTNDYGLATLEIGRGTLVSGDFTTINWGTTPCFLKTEIDPAGGEAFMEIGTSELLSVPYALHSKSAETGGTTYTAGSGIDITGSTVTNTSPNAVHTSDAIGSSELTVVKIQGNAVSTAVPGTNQVLLWNGIEWAPSTLPGGGTAGWALTGNSATNPVLNFIGTTDNVPLILRVNNQKAGRISSEGPVFIGYQAGSNNTALSNTGIGYQALFSNTSGNYNTATGYNSLTMNTTGANNTATGYKALIYNSTGFDNTATGVSSLFTNTTGASNTATGLQSLYYNLTGNFNTASGNQTLYSNTTGNYNTASGGSAMFSNTIGSYNTAIGYQSLIFGNLGSGNTATGVRSLRSNTGSGNTAIGINTLYSNTSGYSNVAVGNNAIYNNMTRSNLVAIGDSALFSNTTGSANTAIGSKALYANSTGSWNMASGFNALKSNTTGNANTACGESALLLNTTGINNSATGTSALRNNTTGSSNTATGVVALYANTDGFSNSALGTYALASNTTGNSNTAIGAKALEHNTNGVHNTGNGEEALNANTTGTANTASGYSAIFSNTTGGYNTATGDQVLYNNTTGNSNTVSGQAAMYNNTTGHFNTAFGESSLMHNSTGSSNIAIGYKAGYWEGGSNKLYIDNTSRSNLTDARSKALIYGEFDADPNLQKLVINANVGIGTINPTYKLSVNGGILAKEVVVFTAWSDFVFDDDYSLMPLNNLENYILINNHLPEIPDAGEVEEKGVSLGNMDARLLQKIEELTLYVIDLNKRVENLQIENQSLKTQINSVVK